MPGPLDNLEPDTEPPVISQRPQWRSTKPAPMTLAAGREYVSPGPASDASRREWIEYYQWCVEVFRTIALADARHRNEAMAEVLIAARWAETLSQGIEEVAPENYYKP
ncbi:AMED_5909 family protein [Actinokineospora auranticolor]|uniref:Uncharacterized protein n=1 Tax=Actinokineospora auranticolor TaxID=155976 RepID=A0A2S6GGW2_9PSEU|nr:AMED_5909 family protein [Actinokineospora auranticolor]PPK64462.1 hypothetical protein CLV40_11926 [Actinokineospora auranticolor]